MFILYVHKWQINFRLEITMFSVASSKMKEYPPSIAFFPRNGIIIPSDYHMLTFVSFPQCLVQRRANSGPYKMVKIKYKKMKRQQHHARK